MKRTIKRFEKPVTVRISAAARKRIKLEAVKCGLSFIDYVDHVTFPKIAK